MRETKSKYAILGMLSIEPMSGYDIKKEIQESISYFWAESYGQIYPVLKSLVAEKLVTKTVQKGAGKPDRHVYSLTERGRKELRAWLAEGASMPKVERNEMLLKLFFGEEVAVSVNIRHVEEFRELQRVLLEKYKAIEKELKATCADNPNAPYWLMTVRYGQQIRQALLDWCDETLTKLNKMVKAAGDKH
ncbi:MAG: PadR family transcriptional regulator [Acidobacteria bacterium]|nr:PadR family transcriptional regulator [Acidobacteriota bacterium]